jgi:hypothetical protein
MIDRYQDVGSPDIGEQAHPAGVNSDHQMSFSNAVMR